MLSRYIPTEVTDGVNLEYSLPNDYNSGIVTIFVNGQLLNTQDDLEHPFGYTLDTQNKKITFFIPLQTNDSLFLLYDKRLSIICFNNIDWSKKLIKKDFDVKVIKIKWDTKVTSINWGTTKCNG